VEESHREGEGESEMSLFPSTREEIREKYKDRNRAVTDAAQWFAFDHLSAAGPRLSPRAVSAEVAELAFDMIDDLPDSPELTHALRRLIEAKDCFVRAAIAAGDPQ
jgi:hypothetical protein